MTSACDEIRSQLSEYFDGALEPDDRTAIESHMAFCAACRKEASRCTVTACASS